MVEKIHLLTAADQYEPDSDGLSVQRCLGLAHRWHSREILSFG
jgi:hypothetical protein